MGTIVVGVDGSEGAAHALHWAMAEAEHRGWVVRAVLAWGFLDQHHGDLSESFDPGYSATDAQDALSTYLTEALGAEAADTVERFVVTDLPARGLLRATEDAQLLVVGARGLGGFRGLLLGSVSQRCLHGATFPVAIIRPDETDPAPNVPPRVVVGVDGSAAARHALTWAADEARARKAVLEVVHAWQPPFVGGFPFTASTVDFSMFEDAAEEVIGTVLDEVDLAGLAAPVERTLVCTGATSALLEAAHRAHVVVVGARGLGGVQRFLLGSVSHQLALHCSRPVVVVPSTD